MILSTSQPGVFITRLGSSLAFAVGQAVERELVRRACRDAKSAFREVIDESDIASAIESIDLLAVFSSLKASTNGNDSERQAG